MYPRIGGRLILGGGLARERRRAGAGPSAPGRRASASCRLADFGVTCCHGLLLRALSSEAREAAAPPEGDGETSTQLSSFGAWRRRLTADQALEKLQSVIRVRQYELKALVEDARTSMADDAAGERGRRLARAAELASRQVPSDRAGADELLVEIDGVFPLVVDDDRLRLMLGAEVERDDTALGRSARKRALALLEPREDREDRRELEALVTAAIRYRNDTVREERIAGELRQNYLTWLGIVLFLLLAGVSAAAIAASSSGIWADIVLAVLGGALGGTLSGVIRMRAPESRLTALKNLGLVMLVQPLVGAVGGLIVFAIWRSGLLSITSLEKDEWSAVVVVAFLGGFSERVFLGSLERIGGGARSEGTRTTAPS